MKFYIFTLIINSLPRWLEYDYPSNMSYTLYRPSICTIVQQLILTVIFIPLTRLNNDAMSQPPDNFD